MSTAKGRVGRPPAESAPATLDEILDAALQMFADKGYDGASVAALNRELGVSHNLIHQRFGSKENLWYAAVDRAFSAVASEMAIDLQDDSGGPSEQVRRLTRRFVQINARRPEILRLVSIEGVAESDRLDYLFTTYINPILTAVTAPLRELIGTESLTPATIRTLYFLIAHGATAPFAAVALGRRIGPGDPLTTSAVNEQADIVADFLLAALQVLAEKSHNGAA